MPASRLRDFERSSVARLGPVLLALSVVTFEYGLYGVYSKPQVAAIIIIDWLSLSPKSCEPRIPIYLLFDAAYIRASAPHTTQSHRSVVTSMAHLQPALSSMSLALQRCDNTRRCPSSPRSHICQRPSDLGNHAVCRTED